MWWWEGLGVGVGGVKSTFVKNWSCLHTPKLVKYLAICKSINWISFWNDSGDDFIMSCRGKCLLLYVLLGCHAVLCINLVAKQTLFFIYYRTVPWKPRQKERYFSIWICPTENLMREIAKTQGEEPVSGIMLHISYVRNIHFFNHFLWKSTRWFCRFRHEPSKLCIRENSHLSMTFILSES